MAWRTVPTKLAGSWVHGAQAGALPGPLVEVCVEPQLGLNVFASVFYEATYCFIVCSILESIYFKSLF